MTDRPVIFSAPMVRALLDGRKTQTRRLRWSTPKEGAKPRENILGRAVTGDRLYARETWSGIFWDPADIDGRAREFHATPKAERTKDLSSGVFYKLDEEAKPGIERFVPEGQWTPSIHMPRWASRLTLIVEAVRLEPLQAISEADAWAEGVCQAVEDSAGSKFGAATVEDRRGIVRAFYDTGVNAYRWLWESLHGADSWEANPEVVAITFRVIHGNIDRIEA